MRIVDLGFGKIRMVIEPNTDLKKASNLYDSNKYILSIEGEFDDVDFLTEFCRLFFDIKEVSISNWGKCDHSFIYNLKKLTDLSFSSFQKEIDFSKVAKLNFLGITYEKKYLKNLNYQTEVENLVVSDYTGKDLKALSFFKNIKYLRVVGSKLKNLNGIEHFSNLKALEISTSRSLTDISEITALQKLKFLEFDICWKMQDFSPIVALKELEVLKLMDCKNLASIKFVKELPKLRQLYTLGTTIINDFDTTPAKDIPVFFGSQYIKYNKEYPEKEIKEGQKTASSYIK
ncbi:MAG: hypothetical protein L3J23_09350 [Flavobacteriaceae bacterium]|nr:hypothetical protein [Flavobacteriaceae bacterium]